jgi:hypothetical protein
MERQQAAKLVRRLLAGYPHLNAHDPEGYIAALVQVMESYPAWAGERAIVRVDAENAKFPPTDRVLRGWLEEHVRPYKFGEEWNRQARKQIAARAPDDEPKKYLGTIGDGGPGTIYSNFEEAFAKHGRPRGFFER